MDNIENSISKLHKYQINIFLICLFAIGIFTPFILNKYLLFVCSVGFLFFINTIKIWRKCLFKNKLFMWCTVLFCIELLYRILGISSAAIGNYALRFLTYISVYIYIYTYTYIPLKGHYFIVRFSILVILLNLLDNIRIYTLYPELRGTGVLTNVDYLNSLGILNLGSTSFSYVILFLGIFSFYIFLLKINSYKGLIYFILFIFFSIYILYYTGSGTIIISFISFIFLVLIFYRRKKIKIFKLFIFTVLFLILLKVFNKFFFNIIYVLEPFVGKKVATRCLVILNIFNGNYSLSNKVYLSRIYFLIFNFKVWLSSIENFILGNGYHTYSGLSVEEALIKTGDGGHSGFGDLIPRYGILGLSICINITKNIFCLKNYCRTKRKHNLFFILFMIFLFNNIFNDIMTYDIIFILLVFYPLILWKEQNLNAK